MKTPLSLPTEYKKKFPADKRKQVHKAFEAVEDYLPKDSHSPWPTRLRKAAGAYGFTHLIAWDGTRGASISVGYPMEPFLKNYERSAGMSAEQKSIFDAVARLRTDRDPMDIDVRRLEERIKRHGFQLLTTLRDDRTDITFLTQDLMSLLRTAKSYKKDTVKLVSSIPFKDLTIVTFDVSPILVHIIAKEKDINHESN